MDQRLVAWGRAVKARRRAPRPTLWLFSDPIRMPDLEQVVRSLPPRLFGLVFRHDGVPGRAALLRRIARICRRRRIVLSVAGPIAPPPGAGRHLRDGRGARRGAETSSAHGMADIVRARRAGVAVIFLSPVFPTGSHPGAPALELTRWRILARSAPNRVMALGGITGANVGRLPKWVAGAGAIGAFRAENVWRTD